MSLLLQLMMGNLMQNERPEGAPAPPLEEMEEALQLYGEAAVAFGDPRRALRWMETPSDVFDGKSPIAILHDPEGRVAIREQLTRVTEGIYW